MPSRSSAASMHGERRVPGAEHVVGGQADSTSSRCPASARPPARPASGRRPPPARPRRTRPGSAPGGGRGAGVAAAAAAPPVTGAARAGPLAHVPGGAQQRRHPCRRGQFLPGRQPHRGQPVGRGLALRFAGSAGSGQSCCWPDVPCRSPAGRPGCAGPAAPPRFRREVATPAPYGLRGRSQISSAGQVAPGPLPAPSARCARPAPDAAPRPAPARLTWAPAPDADNLRAGSPSACGSPADRGRPAASGTGPSTSAAAGSARRQQRLDRSPGPVSAAIRTAGGNRNSARSASSRSACVTGSQRISAWTAGMAASATTTTAPPSAPRPDQRGRVQPAAQRLLGRPQAGPAEQHPAVQQHRGRVPAVRPRLGPRGGHDQRRAAGTWPGPCCRPEVSTGTPGKARPSSSAVRPAPVTRARTEP